MQIFNYIVEIKKFVEEVKNDGKTVGFVPTMGALHEGHLSLVQASLKQTDITIVSIFVNPTQFNDLSDLKNYPRDFEADKKMLEQAGCSIIFNPSVSEMYPEPDKREFDFNGIDTRMEGAHRQGHFNGVAQVVSKLFDAVPANKAYFGLKDFQQVAIIKKLTQILNINIEIAPCKIVRESDGLAMSSRNQLLTKEHREGASIIYSVLKEAQLNYLKMSIKEIQKKVVGEINKSPLFEVEYFELINRNTLLSVKEKETGDSTIGCIAVWAGKVRLIDNIIFNF